MKRRLPRRTLALVAGCAISLVIAQCATPRTSDLHAAVSDAESAAAWRTIYSVLQHPRCLNCHPAGRVPLQGDDSRPHAQNVMGGADGKGVFAMRCATCHTERNAPGAHLPPGAPNWHLPSAAMPLVFEGRGSAELSQQLADPKRNGGKSPAELLHHMSEDPLVGWGWAPGEGRTPVPIPRAELVRAMRTWIDGGCRAHE